MHIGQIIKNRRIELGLSQEELASKLGKTKNVVTNWERGNNNPEVKLIKPICNVLDISANELFEVVGSDEKVLIANLKEDAEKRRKIAVDWFYNTIENSFPFIVNDLDEQGNKIEVEITPLEMALDKLLNDLDFERWSADEIAELYSRYHFQAYLRKLEAGEVSFDDGLEATVITEF